MHDLYLARDLNNELFLYSEMPDKDEKEGIFVMKGGFCTNIPGKLFPDITYENSPKQFKAI